MERRISFQPAFDRRHTDPSKNYGIHGVEIRFVLVGVKGATHFVLSTGMQLEHVKEEMRHKENFGWMGVDVGYHSPEPGFEGHTSSKCDILPGGKCYSDGSAIRAEEVANRFIAEGEKYLWRTLEEDYVNYFGSEDE